MSAKSSDGEANSRSWSEDLQNPSPTPPCLQMKLTGLGPEISQIQVPHPPRLNKSGSNNSRAFKCQHLHIHENQPYQIDKISFQTSEMCPAPPCLQMQRTCICPETSKIKVPHPMPPKSGSNNVRAFKCKHIHIRSCQPCQMAKLILVPKPPKR